ncbi:MAG: TIGR02147 family protein [Pseudobdellovibrio sp.]
MNEQIVIQTKIRSEFEILQQRNPAFSLRAFAKKLQLSPSALSEIISGKRKISKKMAQRLVERMCLNPIESESILGFFNTKSTNQENTTKSKLQKYRKNLNFLKLSADQFNIISEWQHFAVLSLMETKNFISDLSWISKRLSITTSELQKTLLRLSDLNLISKKNNKLIPTNTPLITTDNVTNLAVRKSHYADLDLAKKALDEVSVEDRDFTAITLAVDKSKLAEAKKMIREFQDSLTLFLEDGKKDEVYKMTFYMYPLTRPANEDQNEK